MARPHNTHEREIAVALDFSNRLAVPTEFQIFEFNFVVSFLARPFESFGPSFVT